MAPVGDFSGWDLDLFTLVSLMVDLRLLGQGQDESQWRIGPDWGDADSYCGLFMLRRMRLLHAADGVGGPTTILYSSPPYSYLQSYPPPWNMLLIPR